MSYAFNSLSIPLLLSLGFACQPAHVIATVDKGAQPEARTYLVGEAIWLELKVPLVSGIESWYARFPDGAPDGFTTKMTTKETIFTWIVPKDRISWFGTSGYHLQLTAAEHTRELNVRLVKQTTQVGFWVITTAPKRL